MQVTTCSYLQPLANTCMGISLYLQIEYPYFYLLKLSAFYIYCTFTFTFTVVCSKSLILSNRYSKSSLYNQNKNYLYIYICYCGYSSSSVERWCWLLRRSSCVHESYTSRLKLAIIDSIKNSFPHPALFPPLIDASVINK